MFIEFVVISSEEWGGINVDEVYRYFLEDIYGIDVFEIFNSDLEYFIDDLEFWYYFESKKMEFLSFSFNYYIKKYLVMFVVLSEIFNKK